MFFIHIFILLFISCQYLVSGQSEYACPSNYCSALSICPKFHCKGKNVWTLQNSTDCGCCHQCIKELEEGDDCVKEVPYNTPPTQCGPHLICAKDPITNRNTCKKIFEVKDGCERKAYEALKSPSKVTAGDPVPDCDELGYYASTFCKNGTLCHCVDRNGNRIFGTDTYDNKKHMNCLCSRQYNEVNQKLGNFSINPINFLRCKANGNYEPFQMNLNYTYCVNTTSGEMLERPVLRNNQEKLTCYDKKVDYIQETDCIKAYKKTIEKINKKKNDDQKRYLVVGYDVPNCDIDGSYKPVQCLNSHCFCVNKKGEKYKGFQIDRTDQRYAVNQTCSCVRELELIRTIPKNKWDKVTELFSEYICDVNGNYYPLQCSESMCYCVDPQTGFQKGIPVLKTRKEDMKRELEKYCWDDLLDQTFDDYYQDQY